MFSRRLRYSFLLLLIPLALSAQKKEKQDSLVRLLGCDQLMQEEIDGRSYRKALGHARFEHNATLLLCDTALWNVDENVIKGIGHVRIIQNNTVLTSDNLDYYIGSSQAEFRGTLVQLQDKQKNTLRTRNLDYNTEDSVAVFRDGGAFRDKDGQIIESDLGVYDSKIKLFHFNNNVNMYTDSVFIKTESLDYNTETSVAIFGKDTHAWKNDNMLSSGAGVYERQKELFTFSKNVHLLTVNQEAWSDTLVYDRALENAELMGHAELLDTTRNLTAVAGFMQYLDSLEQIRMLRDPSVIAVFEQDSSKDTVYVRGDELLYRSIARNKIPEGEFSKSDKRLKDLEGDPVKEYRKKAYEAAKAAAEEAKRKMEEEDPNMIASKNAKEKAKGAKDKKDQLQDKALPAEQKPAEDVPPGDVETPPAPSDSMAVEVDSSKIGFLYGLRNVKVFRKDMQVVCDSLEYNDLDSLVRLYRNPIVWNEITHQYRADSITVVMKDKALEKASLMSNAFIIIQQDSVCYDQIKGAEMTAFFDSTGALKRFDSMGGASGLFFLEEKGAYATVNKFEAKMLTANFSGGSIDDLSYFEEVKSDAYPAVQLKKDERLLKGFEWQPEKRPKGPEDVVSYTPRKSERSRYEAVPQAKFVQTERYFPGHIAHVHKMLASADSLKRVRRAERELAEQIRLEQEAIDAAEADTLLTDSVNLPPAGDLAEVPPSESLAVQSDSLTVQSDSLTVSSDTLGLSPELLAARQDSIARADSLARVKFVADSIETARIDSLRRLLAADPTDAQKALKKAEREAKKAAQDSLRSARAAKKEAKWAALDAKDAEKAARKAAKNAVKQEKRMKKMLKAKAADDAREQKLMERYMARYEKKKARKEAAAVRKKKDYSLRSE